MNKGGIPIYKDFWIPELEDVAGDTVLVAGFLNALSMFANQFNWEPAKMVFKPLKNLGVNFEIMFHDEGPFIVTIFMDIYHFREQVKMKLNLVFDEILVKYAKTMLSDEMVELSTEDKQFIRRTFVNFREKELIMERIKELEKFGDNFVESTDIKSIFILSFDGELLWHSKQEKKEEIEMLLEKVHTEELKGHLFNMAMNKEGDAVIISENKSKKFPFIYGLICDITSTLGPASSALVTELDKLFE